MRGAKGGRGKARKTPRREPRDLSRPVDRLGWDVAVEDDGARLDRFLAERLDWRSRTSIVALIEAGRVLRDGAAVTRKAARLAPGERVEVLVPPPEEPDRHEELGRALDRAVLHDDPDVVVLAKPPGLVVHPVGRIRVNTLIQALHWLYRHGPRADPARADALPRICHRLDRDTSGVLVLAKRFAARSAIQKAFERHAVEKEYEAVVAGRLAADRGTIDRALGPAEGAPVDLMMAVRPDGVPAVTHYEVLERFAAATRVRVRLETGRQHQIRVHMQALGHPVLLDALYGDGRTAWPDEAGAVIRRQALHARRLALTHPTTGERLECEAPLPDDMAALVAALRAAP